MSKASDRLRYFCYRCYRCGRLLTRLEIVAKWVETEKNVDLSKPHAVICPCGSRHLTPTNPYWYEELFFPRVWKLWFLEIFLPWLKKKLG